MDFLLMIESVPVLLQGLPLTLSLVAFSVGLGFVVALGVAVVRLSPWRIAARLAEAYVFVFRSTPLLVQLFLIYYGLGQFSWIRESFLWPLLREPYGCAVLALMLNTGAYSSEILRGGIQSVPAGQVEAARACGMSGVLLFRRIIAPLALRQALPAYGNEIILMVKASSLASTVTLLEITGLARKLISQTYAVFEIFLLAGAIYLLINLIITRLIKLAERSLGMHPPAVTSGGTF